LFSHQVAYLAAAPNPLSGPGSCWGGGGRNEPIGDSSVEGSTASNRHNPRECRAPVRHHQFVTLADTRQIVAQATPQLPDPNVHSLSVHNILTYVTTSPVLPNAEVGDEEIARIVAGARLEAESGVAPSFTDRESLLAYMRDRATPPA